MAHIHTLHTREAADDDDDATLVDSDEDTVVDNESDEDSIFSEEGLDGSSDSSNVDSPDDDNTRSGHLSVWTAIWREVSCSCGKVSKSPAYQYHRTLQSLIS